MTKSKIDAPEPQNIPTDTPNSAPSSGSTQEERPISQLDSQENYLEYLSTLDKEALTKELDDTRSRIWVENTCKDFIAIRHYNKALQILNDFLFNIIPNSPFYLKLRATCHFALNNYRLALIDLNLLQPAEHDLVTLQQRSFIYAEKLTTIKNALDDFATALTRPLNTREDHEIIISCLEKKLDLLRSVQPPMPEEMRRTIQACPTLKVFAQQSPADLATLIQTHKTQLEVSAPSAMASSSSAPVHREMNKRKVEADKVTLCDNKQAQTRVNVAQQGSMLFHKSFSEPTKQKTDITAGNKKARLGLN